MFFRFNQNKAYKRANAAFALLSNCFYPFVFSVLAYAISNIVIINSDIDVDIVSRLYILIFVLLFFILALVLDILYFKTKKGVAIDNDEIVITTGYFAHLQSFRLKIKISEIAEIEYIEEIDFRKLKNNYKNYNYGWITFGVCVKKVPVVKIVTNTEHPDIYFIPCENIEDLIIAIKKVTD